MKIGQEILIGFRSVFFQPKNLLHRKRCWERELLHFLLTKQRRNNGTSETARSVILAAETSALCRRGNAFLTSNDKGKFDCRLTRPLPAHIRATFAFFLARRFLHNLKVRESLVPFINELSIRLASSRTPFHHSHFLCALESAQRAKALLSTAKQRIGRAIPFFFKLGSLTTMSGSPWPRAIVGGFVTVAVGYAIMKGTHALSESRRRSLCCGRSHALVSLCFIIDGCPLHPFVLAATTPTDQQFYDVRFSAHPLPPFDGVAPL